MPDVPKPKPNTRQSRHVCGVVMIAVKQQCLLLRAQRSVVGSMRKVVRFDAWTRCLSGGVPSRMVAMSPTGPGRLPLTNVGAYA